jgi:hypothetical protein
VVRTEIHEHDSKGLIVGLQNDSRSGNYLLSINESITSLFPRRVVEATPRASGKNVLGKRPPLTADAYVDRSAQAASR